MVTMRLAAAASGGRFALMLFLAAGCIASLAVAAAPSVDRAATRRGGGGARSELVFVGADAKLQYKPDENGNTIPDFSNCGYRGGGVGIRDLPVRVVRVNRLDQGERGDLRQILG